MISLIAITFVAAIVNGALGYGFSSITVPLALLVVSNRELTPALVLLEVGINAYVLFMNRDAFSRVSRRTVAIIVGLPIGIFAGTTALTTIDASWLKLATFSTLLPLVLVQVAGIRRAFVAERAAGAVLGTGVGALYSVTTVSGPPLALFLTNQGLAQRDFRAAMGAIRVVASTLTLAFYGAAGLVTAPSVTLTLVIIPGVAVGVPLGAWLIRRLPAESFRRICMAADAIIVAFGVSTMLRALNVAEGPAAYLPLAMVLLYVAFVLQRHFRRRAAPAVASPVAPAEGSAS